jgi:hypothetical protein
MTSDPDAWWTRPNPPPEATPPPQRVINVDWRYTPPPGRFWWALYVFYRVCIWIAHTSLAIVFSLFVLAAVVSLILAAFGHGP